MAKSPGISGVAVAMIVAGGVLYLSGLRNAPIPDILRALIKGEDLPSGPSDLQQSQEKISTAFAEGIGSAARAAGQAAGAPDAFATSSGLGVVDTAKKYLGVPYVFGGSSPNGMDCSGFVNYVLGHDLGWPIPGHADGKYSGHGPTAIQYYNWSGAAKIARALTTAGDLVCYTGHIGIAVNDTQMINAAHAGTVVRIQAIWGSPIIRRPSPANPTVPRVGAF